MLDEISNRILKLNQRINDHAAYLTNNDVYTEKIENPNLQIQMDDILKGDALCTVGSLLSFETRYIDHVLKQLEQGLSEDQARNKLSTLLALKNTDPIVTQLLYWRTQYIALCNEWNEEIIVLNKQFPDSSPERKKIIVRHLIDMGESAHQRAESEMMKQTHALLGSLTPSATHTNLFDDTVDLLDTATTIQSQRETDGYYIESALSVEHHNLSALSKMVQSRDCDFPWVTTGITILPLDYSVLARKFGLTKSFERLENNLRARSASYQRGDGVESSSTTRLASVVPQAHNFAHSTQDLHSLIDSLEESNFKRLTNSIIENINILENNAENDLALLDQILNHTRKIIGRPSVTSLVYYHSLVQRQINSLQREQNQLGQDMLNLAYEISYGTLKYYVDNRLSENKDSILYTNARALLTKINNVRNPDHNTKSDLLEVLYETLQILIEPNENSIASYYDLANRVSGHPSKVLRRLGGAMIVLGAIVALIALVATAPSVSMALGISTISISLLHLLSASAISFGMGGLSLFFGKRKGISKTMIDLEGVINEERQGMSHKLISKA